MDIKYIDHEHINSLSISALLRRFKDYFRDPSNRTDTICPIRTVIVDDDGDRVFGVMPVSSRSADLFVVKSASFVRSSNKKVHAVVNAFRRSDGALVAILDGTSATHLKCRAVAALVTEKCSPIHSENLGVIGCGNVAEAIFRAVMDVRKIKNVCIFSRTQKSIDNFLSKIKFLGYDVNVTVALDLKSVLETADIINIATTSYEPLFSENLGLKDNCHINCFGPHTRCSRELPKKLMEKEFLIVEDKETAVVEAGGVHMGAADLFDLFAGYASISGRTILSSTGYAALDLITCKYILDEAKKIDFWAKC